MDRVDRAVAQAWQRVLGAESLALREGFDAAGGDSLAFLHLVHLIERELGTPVDMQSLRLSYTAAEFAAAIRAVTPRPAPGLPGGMTGKQKVFFVPVAGGAGPGQARFRAGCAEQLEIETIALPHWTRIVDPSFRIDSVVASVVDQIVARAPRPPILIAGYCFGGAIASLAARRLYDLGYEVGLLAVLDGDHAWFRQPVGRVAQRISRMQHVRSLRWALQQGRFTEKFAWMSAIALERYGRAALRWLARKDRHQRLLPEAFGFYLNLYLQLRLLPSTDRAGLNRLMSEPGRMPIPMALFRTVDHEVDRPHDLQWSEWFDPVGVTMIGGDHEGLFAPDFVDDLCASFVTVVQGRVQPALG